jgi:hypothetical protein
MDRGSHFMTRRLRSCGSSRTPMTDEQALAEEHDQRDGGKVGGSPF